MSGSLTGLSSMATRALLAALAADFEARTGDAVAIQAMGGVEAARRVRAGEAVDVIVLAAGVVEALEREGHVRPGSRADVVRSPMALAVPDGMPPPDIASEMALRDAILAAPEIHYSTGPSGDQLKRMLARWDIAGRVEERLVQAPAGVPVGARLAQAGRGIGLQQLSELVGVPGIQVAGTLPSALGTTTVFAIGIGAQVRDLETARAFIDHLTSPEVAEVKRRAGFEKV